VRPLIIVIVLSCLKLVVEQVDVVASAVLVEELVKQIDRTFETWDVRRLQ
jgi:hypothetical protein